MKTNIFHVVFREHKSIGIVENTPAGRRHNKNQGVQCLSKPVYNCGTDY